jgi:hypothetical protein
MSKLTQKAYIVGVHRYAFRAGEVAEIIGIKYVKPIGYDWRLTIKVEYADGFIDYVSIQDVTAGNYEIISDVQLGLGQIPVIKY